MLLANSGNGLFADVTTLRLPALPPSFATGLAFDAEGDGDLDLLLSGGNGQLLRNDGSGTFALDTGNWRGDFPPTELARQAIHLDGDRYADLWGASAIYRFFPGAGFRNCKQAPAAAGLPADVDADGDIDLLGDDLLRNDGGQFTPERLPLPRAPLACGDLDGDGDVDAITAYAGRLQTWRNDGSGRFVLSQSLPADPTCSGAALGDVDGDGDLDLATAEGVDSPGRQVQSRLLLNDGTGSFVDGTATHLPAWLGGVLQVLLADVDADGDLDLLYVPFHTASQPLRYLEKRSSTCGPPSTTATTRARP